MCVEVIVVLAVVVIVEHGVEVKVDADGIAGEVVMVVRTTTVASCDVFGVFGEHSPHGLVDTACEGVVYG